jgi:hypothetical protein
MRLEQDVDDLAVLVDGPPEILTPTPNGHEEFVQMPRVADPPGPLPEPVVSHFLAEASDTRPEALM